MQAPGDRERWENSYREGVTLGLHGFIERLRAFARNRHIRFQDPKPLHRVDKTQGPMLFLGQQIVKKMETMGYPSIIFEHWRTPERQLMLKRRGNSKAAGWSSPHQYGEAVDIVHKERFWQVTPEYWDALAACVRVVEKDFNVQLNHGHNWHWVDSAHIEIRDWRTVRDEQIKRKGHNYRPTPDELAERFKTVLPSVSQSA